MRRLAILAAATALTGCAVGPHYARPDATVPSSFAEPQAAAAPTVDLAHWWTAFGDAELSSLIQRALADNPDIRIAASRITQAREQEIAARAGGLPQINADANVSHIHFSKNAGFATLARSFGGGSGGTTGSGASQGVALPGDGITTFALGFDASWELDVFGGVRRGVEAATARTEAAVWDQRDAAVMIAAEVAQAYWALRFDRTQVQVIEDELTRQRRALEIADHRSAVGLTPAIDVTRQRAQITSNEARIEPIRADVDVRLHALAILLGLGPAALQPEFAADRLPALTPAPAVPAGLPSDLLRQRPDIRAAERNLAAATADVGVAVADLYPHFSLTGMAQLVSSSLSNLFSTDSLQASGSAAAMFPILDWGKRRANVRISEAARDQAYLRYRQTVLSALRDVEDPLARIAAEQRRRDALTRAVADAAASAHAVEAQYRTGFVAQDDLLNAQAQLLSAREQLEGSEAQLRQYTATLFKALGGGWEEKPTSAGG